MLTKTSAAIALLAIVAALNSCGSNGDSTASTAQATGTVAPVQNAEVHTVHLSRGQLLVNTDGFAVYTFSKDEGTKSFCSGACAETWRPLLSAGKPKAGPRANGSELGTTEREDGTTQVTYDGHPIYELVGEKRVDTPGGEGATAFGGRWHAVFVPQR